MTVSACGDMTHTPSIDKSESRYKCMSVKFVKTSTFVL